MTRRTKSIVGVCSAVIAIPLFLTVVLLGWIYFSFPDFDDQEHLPDEILIQNFHRHRDDFELLISMLERDSEIHRIDDDWTDPVNISDAKVNEYRRLFAIVGTPRGFYNRRNPLRIELIASSQGWVTSGSMKGYEYRKTKPESLEETLDKFHDGTITHWTEAHRRIDGNWYLVFRR